MAVAGNEDNDRLGGTEAARAGGGIDGDQPTQTAALGDPVDPPRPGPALLDADSWGEPVVSVTSAGYSGRHHTSASRSRLRLALIAGVVAALGIAAIPLLLDGSSDPIPPVVAIDPQLSVLAPTSPADSPGLSPSPSPTPAPTTRPALATVKPPPKPKPFVPVTVEAEAGMPKVTLSGSAWIDRYEGASNGKIARNVGDWDMRGGPGSVRFNEVTVPSTASYVLAISFVHPDNESQRSAQVTVSGLEPVTVTFDGGSTCCSVKKITLNIPAGTHTITISNPGGRAPSIDRMAISSG